MDISSTAKQVVKNLEKYPIRAIFSNPIYEAVLIVGIVILILMYVYTGDNYVQTCIWLFLPILVTRCISYNFTLTSVRKEFSGSCDSALYDTLAQGPPVMVGAGTPLTGGGSDEGGMIEHIDPYM